MICGQTVGFGFGTNFSNVDTDTHTKRVIFLQTKPLKQENACHRKKLSPITNQEIPTMSLTKRNQNLIQHLFSSGARLQPWYSLQTEPFLSGHAILEKNAEFIIPTN